jgi:hypothetical protein
MAIGIKNKTGRPVANQSRVEGGQERPVRSSTGGFRDKLTVLGKDPAYEYRWVKDSSEDGYNIRNMQAKNWEFVSSETGVKVGQAEVFTSENVGSIIRRIAGKDGDFLYLMRIYKDWYEDDMAAQEEELRSIETGIARDTGRNPGSDDLYGSVKIGRE